MPDVGMSVGSQILYSHEHEGSGLISSQLGFRVIYNAGDTPDDGTCFNIHTMIAWT
jgi:hypothetical protein